MNSNKTIEKPRLFVGRMRISTIPKGIKESEGVK
jgi:hypothetical protein